MSTSRRLICAAGLVVGILGAAPMTASATEPVISTRTIIVNTPSPSLSCRPYGYSFGTLATFIAQFHLIQFFGDPTLVKPSNHIDTAAFLTRSADQPKTHPYAPNLPLPADPAA